MLFCYAMEEPLMPALSGWKPLRIARDHDSAPAHHRRAVERADCRRPRHWPALCAIGHLEHRLGDMSHAVQPSLAEAAAERVHWQFALQRDPAVLDERVSLASLAEAGRFQPVERGRAESVVQLRGVHIGWAESRR